MNTFKYQTVFILIAVSLLLGMCKAQDNIMESNCVNISAVQTIPKTGTVKALIIYIKFQDDEYENDLTYDWPHIVNGHVDERPGWTENMLTKTRNGTDFEPSITGYYRSMSFNNFKLYGDVYPQEQEYLKLYLTQHNVDYYKSYICDPQRHRDISTVVWEAITNLDNEIDYSQYDNDQDGYVDELIVWFRLGYFGTTDCQGYNGIANLTGYWHNYFLDDNGNQITEILTNDRNVKIKSNSGLIADGPGRNAIDVMVHEIGHTMGFGHYWHVGKWNMMGARAGVGIMNTYERNYYCQWLPPGSVTIINTPGIYNVNLTDFETTGKAIRLMLNGGSDYILENRAGISFYSKANSWVMPGNGLLITKGGWETIECADHRWNWTRFTGGNCGSFCDNNYTYIYPFIKLNPVNAGKTDLQLTGVCTYDGCKNHVGASGSSGDVHQIGYNQVFSTWSNPNSSKGLNNNDIVVEVVGNRNSDSSIDLRIHYDLPNGYDGSHPSKPLYLRIEKDYFDPLHPDRFHPKLRWICNTEPDVAGVGEYKILRGLVTDLNVDPNYYIITHFSASSGLEQTYIDESISLHDRGGGSGLCQYLERTFAYRIVAVDNEDNHKESVRSDRATIFGYQDPCEPEDGIGNIIRETNIPNEFNIYNYPNPFNPFTDIKFSVPIDVLVKIIVYDLSGKEIAILVNNYIVAGKYSVKFDGTNLASGIYFYKIEAGNYSAVKKMVLIK